MNIPSSQTLYEGALSKQSEIEGYLKNVGLILPEAKPDAGVLPLLRTILVDGDNEGLRIAFGFHANADSLYGLLSSEDGPSIRLRGEAAQRINECLWRLEFTLEYIDADWAKTARARSQALRTVLRPALIASQPSLTQVLRALELSDLSEFVESAPDPAVYAVLRSFRHSHSDTLEGESEGEETRKALDYLLGRLERSIRRDIPFDDSSNAWWAMRTGICRGDQRFKERLPQFLTTFSDPIVPSQEVVKRAYMPESYGFLRTVSYTLSNAQAILECDRDLPEETQAKIREVIEDMTGRLIIQPASRQVYLASVHHEGLRNYRDFVAYRLRQTPAPAAKRDKLPMPAEQHPKNAPEPLQPAPAAKEDKLPMPVEPNPKNPQGPHEEPDIPDNVTGRLKIYSKFGLGGLAIGVFYELYFLLIQSHKLTEAQNSLALLLIYGVSVVALIVGAFEKTKDRWVSGLAAVAGCVVVWLALGTPGLSAGASAYSVRVNVESPSGSAVSNPHVWSTLGGEVKAVESGAEIVIPRSLVRNQQKLKVYAEDKQSHATGSADLDLDGRYTQTLTVKLTDHPDEMVRGMVIDAGGSAVANASASVVGYSKESVQTDAYGGFELNAHKSTGTVALHAEKAPYGIADEPAYQMGSGPLKLTLRKASDTPRRSQSPAPPRVERTGDPVIDRVLGNLALLKQLTRPAPESQIAAALAPLFERPAFYKGIREEDWKYFLYTLCRTRLLIEEYEGRFTSHPDSREKLGQASQRMTALEGEIAKLYGPTFNLADHMARYIGDRNTFVDQLPPVLVQPTADYFAARDREIEQIRDLVRAAGLPVNQMR